MANLKTIAAGIALAASAIALPQTASAGNSCYFAQKVKRTAAECSARNPGLVPGTVYGCVWKKNRQRASCSVAAPAVTYHTPTVYTPVCTNGGELRSDHRGQYCTTPAPSTYQVTTSYTAPASYDLPDTVVEAPARKSWADVPTEVVQSQSVRVGPFSSVARYDTTMRTFEGLGTAGLRTWGVIEGSKNIRDGLAQSGSSQVINNNNGQPGSQPPTTPGDGPVRPGTPCANDPDCGVTPPVIDPSDCIPGTVGCSPVRPGTPLDDWPAPEPNPHQPGRPGRPGT